jgi:DNA adenine methylase
MVRNILKLEACETKTNRTIRVTSPLRYPGGKSKTLRRIFPFIPLHFSEYREPFLGGGSVFIRLRQLNPKAIYRINDLNYDLYCFWTVVKNNVDDLFDEVIRIKHKYKNGRALYEKFAFANNFSDEFHRAVRFYILNRITYSGTVDSGGYSAEAFEKRFTLSNIEKLKPLSWTLQNVEITNESYETLLETDGKNVFIFMDPPYWKPMKRGLYGKNGNLHKFFDHRRFAENVRKCKHKWLITCDDSDLIRELFAFAPEIIPWETSYGMTNAQNNIPSKGKELFISNYVLK